MFYKAIVEVSNSRHVNNYKGKKRMHHQKNVKYKKDKRYVTLTGNKNPALVFP